MEVNSYESNLDRYLQGNVWIQLKGRHPFAPGKELLGLLVDEVVKDSALVGELDGLELGDPPLAELCTIVHKLWVRK